MIARFLALALCAAPFLAQALPAAVIEDLEQVNITTADIEIMLNKRAGDAACPDATGQTSKWANQGNDGNGHYAGSCGSTDHGKAHCWSDIYLTQAQTLWQPWRDCSEYVNCANSDSCQISHLKSIQACATWSTSVGFEAGITSEILNVGASYTSEHGGSSCATTTDTYQIGWLVLYMGFLMLYRTWVVANEGLPNTLQPPPPPVLRCEELLLILSPINQEG